MIVAPMLVALKEIVPQMKYDHARIRRTAQAVADMGDDTVLKIDMDKVQTNIIMLQTRRSHISAHQISECLIQVTDTELLALGEKITMNTIPFFCHLSPFGFSSRHH